MSNLMLQTAAKTRVARQTAREVLAAAAERLHRDEEGQDMIEYAGVIVIVALIIGLVVTLLNTGLGSTITSDLSSTVNNILTGHATTSAGH